MTTRTVSFNLAERSKGCEGDILVVNTRGHESGINQDVIYLLRRSLQPTASTMIHAIPLHSAISSHPTTGTGDRPGSTTNSLRTRRRPGDTQRYREDICSSSRPHSRSSVDVETIRKRHKISKHSVRSPVPASFLALPLRPPFDFLSMLRTRMD